jgi:hypothetical protein
MKSSRQLLALLLAFTGGVPALAGNAVHPAHGSKTMVATVQPEASKVAMPLTRRWL